MALIHSEEAVSRETDEVPRIGPTLARDLIAGRKGIEEVFARDMGQKELQEDVKRRMLKAASGRIEGIVDLIVSGGGMKAERRVELFLALVRLGMVEEPARRPKREWHPGQPTRAGEKSFKVLGGK